MADSMPPAPDAQPPTPNCTYLRCMTPPTTIIDPPYGKAWYGCDEHAPAMSAALNGTAKPIGETVAKSGNSWDDREGPTWIDSL